MILYDTFIFKLPHPPDAHGAARGPPRPPRDAPLGGSPLGSDGDVGGGGLCGRATIGRRALILTHSLYSFTQTSLWCNLRTSLPSTSLTGCGRSPRARIQEDPGLPRSPRTPFFVDLPCPAPMAGVCVSGDLPLLHDKRCYSLLFTLLGR